MEEPSINIEGVAAAATAVSTLTHQDQVVNEQPKPSTNIKGVAAAATAVSTLTHQDHSVEYEEKDQKFMKIAIMCLSAIHNNRFPQQYKENCEFDSVIIDNQIANEHISLPETASNELEHKENCEFDSVNIHQQNVNEQVGAPITTSNELEHKENCEFDSVNEVNVQQQQQKQQQGQVTQNVDAVNQQEGISQDENQNIPELEGVLIDTRTDNNEEIKNIVNKIIEKYTLKNLLNDNYLSDLHDEILCCGSKEEKKNSFDLLVSKINNLPKFLNKKEKQTILLLSVLSKSLVHYRSNEQQNRPNELKKILSNPTPAGGSNSKAIEEKIIQENKQLFKNLLESYISLFEQFNVSVNIEFEFIKHYKFLNPKELNALQRELEFIYQMHNLFL